MSREKQIEEMARDICRSRFDENAILCKECNKECLYYQIATALIAKGYCKQEWISVDERLPKDGETVLTISSEEEMAVCFYEAELEGIFQQCHGLVLIYNITHWMPLPEVPKMKGGKE